MENTKIIIENTKNTSYKTITTKTTKTNSIHIKKYEPSILNKRIWTTNFINHYYNRRTFTMPVEDIVLELDSDDEANEEYIYDEY
jgi:hypothetical protein